MKAIITFQGYTESDSGPTGTEDLYFDVVRHFASKHVTTYQPRTWKSHTERLLDQLIRQRIHDVVLIGYSWGAGYACMRFAKLAPEWGIKVKLALLCDPVYRPLWMPSFLGANPLCIGSLMQSKSIVVPESVQRVCWVRQKISIPKGHNLKAKSPGTRIEAPKVLNYSHTSIDSAPAWHSMVRNELEFLLNPDS